MYPVCTAMRSNPRLERIGARPARLGRAVVGAGRSEIVKFFSCSDRE